MRITKRRIDEERVTMDSLVHCLTQAHGCSVQVVRGDDPPDFWATIDGQRFAVEVTSIVSRAGMFYDADIKQLCAEVERVACLGDRASGTYALRFRMRPTIPKPYSQARRKLIERAAAFVRATQGTEPDWEYLDLIDDDGSSLAIRRFSPQGGSVQRIVHEGCKWEVQCEEELCELMTEQLDRKRTILDRQAGTGSSHPVILALYDAYGFAEPDTAEAALRRVDKHDWFHSVFWAASFADRTNTLYPEEPGRHGRFLYTENDGWRHALPAEVDRGPEGQE